MHSRSLLLAFGLSLVLITLSFAAEEDPVLAKAGEILFRKSDMERLISYSPPALKKMMEENPQQKVALIKRIMDQKIIARVARKTDFDKKPAIKDQLQYLVDDFLSSSYLMETVLSRIAVSEEDVKQYYKANEQKFSIPEQVKARHILIKVPFGTTGEVRKKGREKAEAMIEWLKRGESFERLAESNSEDPDSAKKGGDLGYFARGRMPKPFEEAAFSLKPGQISGVVETDYGYHIISVEDRREAKTRSFEEMKDSIRKQLTEELSKSKLEEFFKQASQDAGLEIYSDRILAK
jgi:peptidyl-prolyl cis-trans isomerase C